MIQLVFRFLFWMFYAGVTLCGAEEITLQQTFSKAHIEEGVTDQDLARLKDIDVSNPLFITK